MESRSATKVKVETLSSQEAGCKLDVLRCTWGVHAACGRAMKSSLNRQFA